MAKGIEEEVKIEDHLFNTVIPKVNSAITETQYEKDRLATEISKQQRRKQRLEEDIVKFVVESNQLYVRTEKNLNYQQPLLMHQRFTDDAGHFSNMSTMVMNQRMMASDASTHKTLGTPQPQPSQLLSGHATLASLPLASSVTK